MDNEFRAMFNDIKTAEVMVREAQETLREKKVDVIKGLVDLKMYECLTINMSMLYRLGRD